MTSPPRQPAMSDVADRAGVSHQTVSRVVNGFSGVRPETRERVLAAIDELGYRRNAAARALVTRRTGTVGVIAPASALFGPARTLVAVEQASRDYGWFVSLSTMRRIDAEAIHAALAHFLDQGVDGITVIAPTVEIVSVLETVESAVPVVLVSSAPRSPSLGQLRTVAVDQRQGARLATRHLIDLYGSASHVAGPQNWYDAADRLDGWREECLAAGVDPPEPIVTGWTAADGFAVGTQLVRDGAPRAIFAANDQLALGLLHAFAQATLRVPEDVAVVGFDDEDGAAYFSPSLTTVRQDVDALGRLAVDTMADLLGGADVQPALVPTELVVRASSVPP